MAHRRVGYLILTEKSVFVRMPSIDTVNVTKTHASTMHFFSYYPVQFMYRRIVRRWNPLQSDLSRFLQYICNCSRPISYLMKNCIGLHNAYPILLWAPFQLGSTKRLLFLYNRISGTARSSILPNGKRWNSTDDVI